MRVRSALVAALSGVALTAGVVATTAPVSASPTASASASTAFDLRSGHGAYRTRTAFPTQTVTDDAGNAVLADRRGRTVQLRGTNLGKFDDITRADVRAMGAAGFTLLRLPIQWSKVEPTQGHYDKAYLKHVESVLDWADDEGILVLVDWHQDVYGPAFGFNGIPEWATRTDGIDFERLPGDDWFANYFHPAVQAAFKHLFSDTDLQQAQVRTWTHLAKRLSGHPALLGYDLFNEPMGQMGFEDLDDPMAMVQKSAAFETDELPAMYDRLISGIRSVDSRSWLFVEPTVLVGEGVPTALPGFDDPRRGDDRIGYAPHAYSTAVEAGGDWDTSSGFVEAYEAAITAYPRSEQMPVIVGEWGPIGAGASYPGNVELVEQQARSFESFASGWAIWYGCVSPNGGAYCVFADDEGRLDPGRAGAWTPYAVRLAGVRQTESVADGTYAVTFDPQRGLGASQIVVPSGFGDDVAVTVEQKGRRALAVTKVSRPTRAGARTVDVVLLSRGDAPVTVTLRAR
ncbi:endoglycosylceramidase [Mumia flava]|uniref:Endoglycosylceramidase n=1 Tax=Mumia flava TaxID=1348852 RepID=A0A2M9BDY5_9ACTN|nr:cellulase family glycosylhydrolase [Mumia flava]PJJ56170.1 endoglycosylceramidase [Mumia flava]